MSTLVVLQPNFVPWAGNFDLILRADTFVFLDDVQYTKNDWRNRNRILHPDGRLSWLTVPVHGGLSRRIDEVGIDWRRDWRRKHLATLRQSYGRAPYFAPTMAMIERAYGRDPARLVDLTIPLTIEIARALGATTRFLRASALGIAGDRNRRLVAMAQALGARRYLSGPAARDYIDPAQWQAAGIALEFIAYPDYPAHAQIAPGYRPGLSILDRLMMVGAQAGAHIRDARGGGL